jgi:hypothetical protein
MDKKELIGFLEINEPVFIYNNKEFGICNMGDFIIAGNHEDPATEQKYNTVEELLDDWIVEGVKFSDIANKVLTEYFN